MKADSAFALLNLCGIGLFDGRIFEALLSSPEVFNICPENPVSLHTKPTAPSGEVEPLFQRLLDCFPGINVPKRELFATAARWFVRALHAEDRLARFLYLWAVLEIHPAGGKDVVGKTCEMISEEVFEGKISPSDVKAKLDLGRICGIRVDIVHYGLSVIDQELEKVIETYTDHLEACALCSLRSILNFRPRGPELKEIFETRPSSS